MLKIIQKYINKKYASLLLACTIIIGAWILPAPYNVGRIIKATQNWGEPYTEWVNYIVENTNPEDKIQVIGNNVAIYLKSDRKASCKYMYLPPLDVPETQTVMIPEINRALSNGMPKIVILNNHEKYYHYFSHTLEENYIQINKNIYQLK